MDVALKKKKNDNKIYSGEFTSILIENYEVWQKCNEANFFNFSKSLFLSNINVISFKIVPLGSYTPIKTLFPLLVSVLEIFNRDGLQRVHYTFLDVF